MTTAELRIALAEARERLNRALALYDAVPVDTVPPALRAALAGARQRCADLLAATTDEAIEAELTAGGYAGRLLTFAEAQGLVRKR